MCAAPACLRPACSIPSTSALPKFARAYVWDRAHSVSCHNDPVPANILFDGKRLWLIDWESAYRNDPLVDVAIVPDHFARTPELRAALMRAWLGRAPDEALLARLELVAALTRLYYAGVFFSASALAPRTAPDSDLAAPTRAGVRGGCSPRPAHIRHAAHQARSGQDVRRVVPVGCADAGLLIRRVKTAARRLARACPGRTA